MKQGAMTTEEPYNVIWFEGHKYEVWYKNDDKIMWGNSFNPKMVQNIVLSMNYAYKTGYYKCSVDVMNDKTN